MKKHTTTPQPPSRREMLPGWIYLIAELFFLPSLLSAGNRLLPRPLSDAWLNFLFFSLNFLVILLIFHRLLRAGLTVARKDPWNFLVSSAACFVLYWLCAAALNRGILLLDPSFSNANDGSIAAMAGKHYRLMAIGTVLLVPPVEECLYRGLIFGGLYRKNRFLAYLLSILAFCAIHVLGFLGTRPPLMLALSALQYVPAGFFLALAFQKTGTIWSPILVHAAINAAAMYSVR